MTSKLVLLRDGLAAIALVIASTLIGLALLEGMVRLVFSGYDPSGQLQLVVSVNGLRLGPANQTLRQTKNTGDYDVVVRFNARGLRDAKDIANAGFADIIVVGDSFAFGFGVEEEQRFSNLLQSRLQRRVFNVAVPSADFEVYDKLLKYAASVGAKIEDVVIAVCMENDLHLYSASRPAVSNTKTAPAVTQIPRPKLVLDDIKAWLTRNSAAYLMATTVVQQNPILKKLAVSAKVLVPNLVRVGLNRYSESVIEHSANRLAQIAHRYKRTKILIIPSRSLWVGNNRFTEDRVHREFVDALFDRNLYVVDLRQLFESDGHPLSNHFRDDGHWNSKGHRSAAKALATAFTE